MQDANRLDAAAKDATARQRAREAATTAVDQARRRLRRSTEETEHAAQRMAQAERHMTGLRRDCATNAEAAGLTVSHSESPLAILDAADLAALAPLAFDQACAGLRSLVLGRREQIAVLRQRHAELAAAESRQQQCRQARDERQDAVEAAAQRREQADTEVEQQGRQLIEAWERHFGSIQQLHVSPDDSVAALAALADWVLGLDGDNPARHCLQAAQQQASLRLAQRRVSLDGQRQTLQAERDALDDERHRLEAGIDTAPPLPATRDAAARTARARAPLWQLVDFRDTVTAAQRAGLEAALEAAGLLDAWVSPDGRLQADDGGVLLHDTQVLQRQPHPQSLAAWLQPRCAGRWHGAGRADRAGAGGHRLRRRRSRRQRSLGRPRRPLSPRRAGRRLGQTRGGPYRLCRPRRGPCAAASRDRRAPDATRRRPRSRAGDGRATCP